MKLQEAWEISRKFITEYTGKQPGENGPRNTTQYDVDKGSEHSYIETYQYYFEKYKSPVNMMEIGISGGFSLYMWKKYFGKESNIVGIDIDPLNLIWKDEEKTVKMIFSDVNNHSIVNSQLGDMKFDIIIDDGSHVTEDMIDTFNFLWSRVNHGGTYIMEDVDMNYPDRVQKILQILAIYSPKLIDLRHIKGRYDDAMIVFEK